MIALPRAKIFRYFIIFSSQTSHGLTCEDLVFQSKHIFIGAVGAYKQTGSILSFDPDSSIVRPVDMLQFSEIKENLKKFPNSSYLGEVVL